KPAASVHPEPGSNSPLYEKCIVRVLTAFYFLKEMTDKYYILFLSKITSNSKNLVEKKFAIYSAKGLQR
ncbi:hypothetical protein, partial [uncultured Alistipes sp.]|uniref:hypothetical protein n=1 Tax=uncultured Alistipes sp. TaxID=538949 RepID=UPI0026169FC4